MRILIGLLALSLTAPGFARGTDRPGFTAEERTRFDDTLDKFPRSHMPDLAPYVTHMKIFWIDNRRLITTARKLPSGWEAVQGEPSKIIVLDTETGKVEETPYRGDLECYSDERMIVRMHPPGKGGAAENGSPMNGDFVVEGRLGEALRPVDWPKTHEIASLGCQFVDRDGVDGFRTYRLSKDHGVLKVAISSLTKTQDGSYIHLDYGRVMILESADGKLVKRIPSTPDTSPPLLGFRYLPFRNEYVVQGAFPSPVGAPAGSLLSPSGTLVALQAPLMLHRMAGSGVPWPVKGGIVWQEIARRGNWLRQGLYWQAGDKYNWHDGEKIFRVDDAYVNWVAVSPDGCKIFYRRYPGDPYIQVAPPRKKFNENVVMTLCLGEAE